MTMKPQKVPEIDIYDPSESSSEFSREDKSALSSKEVDLAQDLGPNEIYGQNALNEVLNSKDKEKKAPNEKLRLQKLSKFYEEPIPVKSADNMLGTSSSGSDEMTPLDQDFFKLERRDSLVKTIANVNMANFEVLLAILKKNVDDYMKKIPHFEWHLNNL